MNLEKPKQRLFSPSPHCLILGIIRLFPRPPLLPVSRVFFLGWVIFFAAITAGISQEADLVMLDFTFSPQSIDPGAHPTSVTYTFGNAGPDDIDADSVVSEVFLSRNSTFGDVDDVRIWQTEHFFGLFSYGTALMITLSSADLAQITIPSDASGDYYVFAFVDHSGGSSYYDPDVSDNHLSRVGTIRVNPPPGITLTGAPIANQGFQLTVNGIAGRSYRFDGSTDLKNWDQLSTVVANPSAVAQYLDTAATTLNHRFYRAALLPP